MKKPADPLQSPVNRTRQEVLQETSRQCGRFKIPTHVRREFELLTLENPAYDSTFAGSGTPLNWQNLLQYLFEQQIIVQPHFQSPFIGSAGPTIHNLRLNFNYKSRKTDGGTKNSFAYGASLDTEEAMAKTVGETLERYFLSLYRADALLLSSFSEMKKKQVPIFEVEHLNSFLPFQREAFPSLQWDVNEPLYWVAGQVYPEKKPVWIPAQLIFWNYRHAHEGKTFSEKILALATTSGCAGHFSQEEAILSGLLEHIQRDAFFIFWLNNMSPPVLDISSFNDVKIKNFIQYLNRHQMSVTFLNTTVDISVPSITCVLRDTMPTDGPIFSIGACSGFDISNCLMQSVLEALEVNNYVKSTPRFALSDSYVPFRDSSIDRQKRLSMWRGPVMEEKISFFTTGKQQDIRQLSEMTKGKETPRQQLRYLLRELKKLGPGHELYVYEARDKVLDSLAFHVVRTIVPALFPLYLREHAAPLDSQRLREVPKKIGYFPGQTVNPWPHPFP